MLTMMEPDDYWNIEFYGFYYGFLIEWLRFSIIVALLEIGWIFMTFTTDFQWLPFLCMIITKDPHANYDRTQQFLKYIQPAKGGLDKAYINIYVWWLLSIPKLAQQLLKIILSTKDELDKSYINIYIWWLLNIPKFN